MINKIYFTLFKVPGSNFNAYLHENAHQPTRRKEKCLIKFKSPQGVQRTVSLMGKSRNLFSLEVGRYSNKASQQKAAFKEACSIWSEAAQMILCA